MSVVFASLAQQEFDDAVAWYEDQMQGLGERFRAEARHASKHTRPPGLSNAAKCASTC